jgi:DNA adenine methylase
MSAARSQSSALERTNVGVAPTSTTAVASAKSVSLNALPSPQPFLKWAGGKRQLLSTILPALPDDLDLSVNRFFEPFMGGAAVTWALASDVASETMPPTRRKRGRPIVLNDANDELATTYRVVQNNTEALIDALRLLEANTSGTAYYAVRAAQPTDAIERAARTIFLNRLCFNGLYRVNARGEFNVSYGKVARTSICNAEVLRACATWLRHAEVRSGSYVTALADAREGDVVYLDPPYIPLSPTASFAKYTKDDFSERDQWALAEVIKGLVARGVRVIFSNSNTELTRTIFGSDLNLYALSASRSIAADKDSRARVEEVLGISYAPNLARDPAMLLKLRRLTTATRPSVR